MCALRWALAAPGAIAAWFVTFLVGVVTYGITESALCPAGEMESGMCLNSRVHANLKILIFLFVALSAIAVVATAVVIVPTHKRIVAWVVFVTGSLAAVIFAVETGRALGEGICAVVAGFVATFAIDRYLRHIATTAAPPLTHAT